MPPYLGLLEYGRVRCVLPPGPALRRVRMRGRRSEYGKYAGGGRPRARPSAPGRPYSHTAPPGPERLLGRGRPGTRACDSSKEGTRRLSVCLKKTFSAELTRTTQATKLSSIRWSSPKRVPPTLRQVLAQCRLEARPVKSETCGKLHAASRRACARHAARTGVPCPREISARDRARDRARCRARSLEDVRPRRFGQLGRGLLE